jgi:ABC-type polysaccharide/polyol phosphate transport system ATPase subunit
MLENNLKDNLYTQATIEIDKGNVSNGLSLFYEALSNTYKNVETLFEYNPFGNKSGQERLESEWIHKGDGSKEIVNNLIRTVGLGGSESILEHDIDLDQDGVIIDCIMQRISGGEEDSQLFVDSSIGHELVRFNKNSVHLSSNSSKLDLDFGRFHAFRLIIENNVSALIVDGKSVLLSSPFKTKNLNKISFGSAKGLSSADSESLWALVRIGHGKNLFEKTGMANLVDNFYDAAEKKIHLENKSSCIKELMKSLLLNPTHAKSLDLLKSAIDKVSMREPAVYLISDLVEKLNNPEIAQYWSNKKTTFNSKIIIEAENVGVKFLTSMNTGTFAGMWDSFFSKTKSEKYFWALKDVSMKVLEGEIVGIIGRNGSGKSTLLRVIANILTPDEGHAKINGKAILLSPGLGIREELSGRDNVYLGCMFMGMTKNEIDEQFDNIVNFAELGPYIDRTFRYYSDGMKSRLTFSLATHVHHEILLLDELLSAGDISFNHKAAKRMEELVKKSKTAVIVTHSTQFVREHCTRALYLEKGHVKYFGDPDRAVDMYVLDSKNSLS